MLILSVSTESRNSRSVSQFDPTLTLRFSRANLTASAARPQLFEEEFRDFMEMVQVARRHSALFSYLTTK